MKRTHPRTRQWIDYVRGLAASTPRAEMEEHLGGCSRCARQVQALESVRRVARADLRLAPPQHAVRAGHDIFRIERLLAEGQRAPSRLELSFDSLLAPAPAGVRAELEETRHLVFESPQHMVGLQLHAGADGEAPLVTGQVIDLEEGPLDGVSVSLFEDGRLGSQARSDRQGEFRLSRRSAAPARVVFGLRGDELVDLEVPGAQPT